MKISIDISRGIIEKAGIGRYVVNLLDALATIDKTNYYQLQYSFWRKDSSKDKKAKEIYQKFNRYETKFLRLPGSLKEWWWGKKYFPNSFLVKKTDIFHAPSIFELPLNLSFPSVVTIHDMTTFLFPDQRGQEVSKRLSERTKKVLEKAQKIIAISQNTKKDIVKFCQIPREKIIVTPLAAGSDFKPNKFLQRQDFILGVGTIEPRKNLKRLILAYAKLPEDVRKKHQLKIVGASGWNDSEIYKVAKPLVGKRQVDFLGYISDQELLKLYCRAKVFVYPSLYEGFGIPPLEAMSCSTPVITSNVSSLPEVTGDAALLVNPEDTDDIYRKIRMVLSNKKLCHKLSEKGLNRAKKFSWEKCAQQTLKVYEELFNTL